MSDIVAPATPATPVAPVTPVAPATPVATGEISMTYKLFSQEKPKHFVSTTHSVSGIKFIQVDEAGKPVLGLDGKPFVAKCTL
jgi:hypothetical protein